ncbi:MAG TPA: hypothetical protein DEA08_11875, partial [Planctomycetes bacterium]|nr:hypothetical protein [Planctomycetota bacterium]
ALRTAAIQALGALGREASSASTRLGALLQDADPAVRGAAAVALGQIGPAAAPAVPALLAAWKDAGLRPALAQGLAGIGSASVTALPQLRESWLRGKGEERQRAGEALARIGGEGVGPLLLVARDRAQPPELRALGCALAGRVRGKVAENVRADLWLLLTDADPQSWDLAKEGFGAQAEWYRDVLPVRFWLNAALSKSPPPAHKQALEDVKQLLADAEPFLKRIEGDPGQPAAIPALVELLAEGKGELAAQAEDWLLQHARQSMAVIEALERLPPKHPRAEAFLRQLTGRPPLPAVDDLPKPAQGQRYVFQTQISTSGNPLTMDMIYTIEEVHPDKIVYSVETTVMGHTTNVPKQEWRRQAGPQGPLGVQPNAQTKAREETLTIAGRTWRARVYETTLNNMTSTTWLPWSDAGPTWPPFLKVHSVSGQSTTRMELVKVELP